MKQATATAAVVAELVELPSTEGDGGSFDGSTFSNADLILTAGQNRGNGSVVVTGVSPVAVTPEPSSLALLGTGLLSVIGVLLKRFA